MDDDARRTALLSALTTEHFVLQTASTSTISEAAGRSSLYIFALSSSLVAIGFLSQSPDLLVPFVAVVLPALFVLGIFTVARLVDTVAENMQYLAGIARIRGHYRSLIPEGTAYFSAETGRWPEARATPSLFHGPIIAFVGTTASMIAFIDSVVAGVRTTLLMATLLGVPLVHGVLSGLGGSRHPHDRLPSLRALADRGPWSRHDLRARGWLRRVTALARQVESRP
jgi:hypothetical protein